MHALVGKTPAASKKGHGEGAAAIAAVAGVMAAASEAGARLSHHAQQDG